MKEEIAPYTLPAEAQAQLMGLAAEADQLVLGEIHGTQEVPRLLLGLREPLAERGYRGLALEIPCDQREPILDWAQGRTEAIPAFFQPGEVRDGRESAQSLSLLRQMTGGPGGWRLLCFDRGNDQPYEDWAGRDATMAANLVAQWQQLCPDGKVVAVCGNLHSRVALSSDPEDPFRALWPSFAFDVQRLLPEKRVRSVNIVFHGGTFYNETERTFASSPLEAGAEIRPSRRGDHTLELHLPHATAVTFLDRS